MAQDYSEFLAAAVLNERQYVSYRTLSRALKVHSNLAKQMLYEFHRKQNAKKPGAVHATYLLVGRKRASASSQRTNGSHEDGADVTMQSSPPLPSSSMAKSEGEERDGEEVTPVRTVLLVKEEQVEQARGLFDSISSIHIYSLEAGSPSDVQVLTECNRKIAAAYATDDPLVAWKQYGTIQNPNVKRRTRKTGPPPAIAKAPATKTVTTAQSAKGAQPAEALKAATKPETSQSTTRADPKPVIPNGMTSRPASKPATSKKTASDIFKSFAKGRTAVKTSESQGSDAPTPKIEAQDEVMSGFSDDDGVDEDDLPVKEDAAVPEGKSKKEREADLQAMMDQEDEPMEVDESPAAEEEEPDAAIDKATPTADEPKETVTVENGRRRGRRRVMKKKTVKDEDGYLVTKEEAAWESFSEEEPAPKKAKLLPATSNTGAGKAAKKGGKPQGNIMSFFGKK